MQPEPTPPMDNPFLQPRCHPAWMVACVGLVALADLLSMPLDGYMPGDLNVAPFVMAVLNGVTLAQFGVVATWLVFSERALLERLALHWLLALVLFGFWMGGAIWVWSSAAPWRSASESLQILLTFGLSLAPTSVAVQLPLWFCRSVLGWRLIPFAAALADRPAAKLSILDLMIATAVVAVSIACMRLEATREPIGGAEAWVVLGLGGLALCVASAVVLLPLIVVILRPRLDRVAAAGLLLVLAAWLAVIDIPLVVVAVRNGAGRNPGLAQIVAVTSLFLVSFLATLAVPLWLVRWDGYRLVFPGDARRAAQRGLAGRAAPS